MRHAQRTERKESFVRVHFIGIGGISMSAMAEIALADGHQVSGSDVKGSKIVERLVKKGVKFHLGHHADAVKGADLVIYTSAVQGDNPELVRAREEDIPVLSRAEMLGRLMQRAPKSVAVAGSHGKTTTTSMITEVLLHAGLDPTALVGGELDSIGGNVRLGSSEYFVTEACEYTENFLYLKPHVGIILNIDLDHVDYFKSMESIVRAFERFATVVDPEGCLVVNADDNEAQRIGAQHPGRVLTYGINENATIRTDRIEVDSGFPVFHVTGHGEDWGVFRLAIPGKHNVYNALATIATASFFGVDRQKVREALAGFRGTGRRFEYRGEKNGVTVVDDYAHHPAEIRATLKAAREFSYRRIVCVFQPHTYSRTKALLQDFAAAFSDADLVIFLPIYAAREKDHGEVTSSDLAKKAAEMGIRAVYVQSFAAAVSELKARTGPGDLVLTMGAGDVYQVGDMFLCNGEQQKGPA